MIAIEERFWAKVDTAAGPDACWPWIGSKSGRGYGQVWFEGRLVQANRVALQLALGRPLRPGMQACHHCDNAPCVNPAHLFEGTASDNMQDMLAKGRAGYITRPDRVPRGDRTGSRLHPERRPRGERHPLATVSHDQVEAARALVAAGATRTKVALAIGVSLSTVSLWCLGKRRTVRA